MATDNETPPLPTIAPASATPAPANGGTPAPVASGPAAPAPGTPAPGPVSPALFGGHRGGKKTVSGYPVGSPEHADFMRRRDAEQTAARRAARKAAEPPPALPAKPVGSTLPPREGNQPPAPGMAAPAVNQGTPSAVNLDGLPGVEAVPAVAWMAKDIAPLVHELVELTEELCTKTIQDKVRQAKLPKEVAAEIAKDAEWAERAKKMVEAGLADIFAKQLNTSQVPVEVRPWIMVSIGALQIAVGQMKILKRLDELIAVANRQAAAAAEVKGGVS